MKTNKTKKTAPVFMVIADDLRDRIRGIGPGERLPTEAELSEEYSTTRTTIRAALRVLIDALVVEKRGLAGYFVREVISRTWQLVYDDGSYADPWQTMAEVVAAGRARQAITVRIEHAGAPIRATTLADLLDVDPQALVACRSATRYLDDEPVEMCDIYVPYELVKDGPFMSSDDLDVYALLSATSRMVRSRDAFAFRNPAPSEKARLELPEATGVVEVVRRLFYDDADQAMVVHSVYSAAGAEFITCARA